MTLARRSRSASACLDMARCMSWGRSTFFTSTVATLIPHGLGVLVDDPRELGVDLVARGEQVVELLLTEHAAQRGLGDLGRGVEVVLDADHRLGRVEDAEEDHRVHLHRHVVAGDDVLRRHVHGDRAQAHLHHLVDERHEEEEARPRPVAARVHHGAGPAAEAEDHPPLVLAQDAHRRADDEEGDDQHRRRCRSIISKPMPVSDLPRPRASAARRREPPSG